MTRFLGIAAFLVAIGFLTAQPADDGVEVQTRGPIHEAFAQPADQHPSPAPLVAKKPPDPIEEIPPDQKPEGDDVIWIPGYFAFDADRDDFLWISGIWRSEPPDRQWIPGYWQHEEGGYRWVGGYWALETQTSIELLPPPPQPVEEVPPPQTDVNTVYVPGVWVYRTDRYLWQPGHWITARPGWIWTPPNYCWSPRGYIFVPGYWDFELHRR
jgi:hypothetical protein